ncbi:MAG: hypothetical protein LBL45_11880, partial [Treponema sp.]|nr:hypothetical protein [Treponema sp.]
EKPKILGEVIRKTGYNQKYALRLIRKPDYELEAIASLTIIRDFFWNERKPCFLEICAMRRYGYREIYVAYIRCITRIIYSTKRGSAVRFGVNAGKGAAPKRRAVSLTIEEIPKKFDSLYKSC